MELRLPVAVERGYGNVCWCPAKMKAFSPSSSLSFCNTFTNPSLNSLLYKPYGKQGEQQKKQEAIIAGVKWQKDPSLDAVIQRQKRLRRVIKIKDLLIKEPGMCMSLRDLGKYKKKMHLTETKRLVTLLKQYPAIFELFEEGISNMYFRLTPEAEELFLEEQQLKTDMESLLVSKIRKMLMMSVDKTLLVFKFAHLKKDFGLPDDFKTNLIEKYPQFFKPVELEAGPALELTSWDPQLTVSAWEKQLESGPLEQGVISSHANNARRFMFPKSYQWKSRSKAAIRKLQDMTYVSPYSEFAHLAPSSHEAERHSCAVVHEILSLTLEKRVHIDFLTHFRRDYRFSQQLYGMLVRHPELFYVSRKGDRDCVFLREAYKGGELIDKEPLVLLKEKLGMLIGHNEQESDDEDDEDVDGDEEEEDDSFPGDEVLQDASYDSNKEDEVRDLHEQSSAEAPDRQKRVPRRPLIVLQKEKEMATSVSSADRW